MLIGYARVSTGEQNLSLQRTALEAAGCAQIFEDRGLSGAAPRRPALEEALAAVGPGDVLAVWKLDWLGRSLPHLLQLVERLKGQGAGFRSLTEAMDTTTPGGELIFHVMGALAQFERSLIIERTRAGMILLGAAPCTAMVFVWSQLTKGDPNYTLVQVSLNDVIMIFAFAPIVALLLGVTDLSVPWETLLLSVVLYIVIPLAAGVWTRMRLTSTASRAVEMEAEVARFTARVKPYSMLGLLATVVLLFGFQGEVILGQPLLIAMIAVPLLIQSYGIFALAYSAAWLWRVPHPVAAPCAMIGTSNFFELAVAVAIGLFGLNSGAALVTVVGVLVEVPVMLSLVAFANRTRHWFPAICCAWGGDRETIIPELFPNVVPHLPPADSYREFAADRRSASAANTDSSPLASSAATTRW